MSGVAAADQSILCSFFVVGLVGASVGLSYESSSTGTQDIDSEFDYETALGKSHKEMDAYITLLSATLKLSVDETKKLETAILDDIVKQSIAGVGKVKVNTTEVMLKMKLIDEDGANSLRRIYASLSKVKSFDAQYVDKKMMVNAYLKLYEAIFKQVEKDLSLKNMLNS